MKKIFALCLLSIFAVMGCNIYDPESIDFNPDHYKPAPATEPPQYQIIAKNAIPNPAFQLDSTQTPSILLFALGDDIVVVNQYIYDRCEAKEFYPRCLEK